MVLATLAARGAAQEMPQQSVQRRGGPFEPPARGISVSFGSGEQTTLGTVSLGWDHRLRRWHRVQVGYGIRISVFGGESQEFREAESDVPPDQRERITIADPRLVAVNFFAQAQVAVLAGVAAGFNIDVIGIGFGPSLTGIPVGATTPDSTVTGQHFNLLQGGIRDRGSLNSEFYVAFRVLPRVVLRGGFAHAVSGYRSGRPTGERKYHRFVTLPFAAVRFGG